MILCKNLYLLYSIAILISFPICIVEIYDEPESRFFSGKCENQWQ